MGTLEAMAAAAVAEVEAGGFTWKIRKVTTMDMLGAGKAIVAAIPAVAAQAAEEITRAGIKPSESPTAEQIKAAEKAADAAIAKAIMDLPEAQIRSLTDNQNLVVAAGTTAVKEDEGWRQVRIVVTGESDPEANVLRVADLPPGVVPVLFDEITKLTQGKEAVARIATFLGRSGSGTPGGPDRETEG